MVRLVPHFFPRKPRVVVGVLFAFLVGIVLAWFALTEIVYQMAVADIAPRIAPPPQRILPLRIRQVAWVQLGETGKMRMRPAHLGWLPVAFFGPAFLEKHPRKLWYGPGFSVSGEAQVTAFADAGRSFGKRHLATLWITRHWTADQAISESMRTRNFGCEGFLLDSASRVLLGRSADSLNLSQVVALLAMEGPLGNFLGKDSLRFGERYDRLQTEVVENFPELIPERGPMPRFLVSACPTKSMDSLQGP